MMQNRTGTLGLEAACSAVSWTTLDQKHSLGAQL